MQEKYNVILVGAGPTGIFSAYELNKLDPNLKILLLDKGHDIYHRHCPILDKKIDKCPQNKRGWSGCMPACSINCGFGGSGAYSDGKFNITDEFGGWLNEYLENGDLLDLIRYADSINLEFGAPESIVDPYTAKVEDIERRGMSKGLKLLKSYVRHLGTDINIEVLKKIYEYLKERIDMSFRTTVQDIIVEDDVIKGVLLKDERIIYCNSLVLGVGRNGSDWLFETLKKYDIPFRHNRVDIGVRVETNDIVMKEINDNLYEGKFIFNSSVGTIVRTFCANPSGHVVIENYNGVEICNGHSFNDPHLGSKNTNFAILVSHTFDEPFKDPNTYAFELAKLANKLANGNVIIQKYGDIKRHRRSTQKRIDEGFVKPTLKEAVPGDLGLVLPYNTMQSIIEMVEALDSITPGIANDHTLFYGIEAKFYSARPEVNKHFETKIKNLYVGGDGAGITRGLAQASANGIYIARQIKMKIIE